ncbi:MAG: ribbon-helix-helix protein, CopG family [Dehalococcoidales bacterium]|nr:ribbon-helix-helix protein, CopG family [Dehalococcoidales bacterium]
MPKIAKIAISLPEDVLQIVEQERKSIGESRSQFFRRAVECLLRIRREREASAQYIQAYQKASETKEEVAAARKAASAILAEEPW